MNQVTIPETEEDQRLKTEEDEEEGEDDLNYFLLLRQSTIPNSTFKRKALIGLTVSEDRVQEARTKAWRQEELQTHILTWG